VHSGDSARSETGKNEGESSSKRRKRANNDVQGKTVAVAASQGITVAAAASLGSTDEVAASTEEGVRVDVAFAAKVEVGQRVMGISHGKTWCDTTIAQVVANEDGLGRVRPQLERRR